MQGWIKLDRSILNWEWWDESQTLQLFIYCLLKANHAPGNWRGMTIQRGQFWCSVKALSAATNISAKGVRTSMDRLVAANCLADSATARGRMITVVNYDLYQSNECKGQAKSQTDGELRATNKNDKNKNNSSDPLPGGKLGSKASRPTRPIDDDFMLTEAMISWASKNGYSHISLERETGNFIDYWLGRGVAKADWVATWRNWIKKAAKDAPTELEEIIF